jgi:hypothetical protein
VTLQDKGLEAFKQNRLDLVSLPVPAVKIAVMKPYTKPGFGPDAPVSLEETRYVAIELV